VSKRGVASYTLVAGDEVDVSDCEWEEGLMDPRGMMMMMMMMMGWIAI
jgi:hypothetical protein